MGKKKPSEKSVVDVMNEMPGANEGNLVLITIPTTTPDGTPGEIKINYDGDLEKELQAAEKLQALREVPTTYPSTPSAGPERAASATLTAINIVKALESAKLDEVEKHAVCPIELMAAGSVTPFSINSNRQRLQNL